MSPAQSNRFFVVTAMVFTLSGTAIAQTPVRIATWNVFTVGSPGTTEYDAAVDVLGRIGADVVAINEVNGSGDVPNFEQLAADAGYAFTVIPGSNPFGAQRNAFMSSLPIVAQTIHTSASLSGDGSANDITRLLVEITVDVPGDAVDLTLVVEHWKSGTADSDEFRRASESFRMAQTVSDLVTGVDAYVFMGDINEEIDSVPRTPNPFTSLPGGLPASFSLGADLDAEMNGPGIENNPFFYLEQSPAPGVTALPALQLDGSDGTRPASGRRLAARGKRPFPSNRQLSGGAEVSAGFGPRKHHISARVGDRAGKCLPINPKTGAQAGCEPLEAPGRAHAQQAAQQ
jgi:endonuclease/exonuclease/phosphatase family metal-dependent hydrolase